MNLIPALLRLGFSEYEARTYVALVRRNPLNGYELAREAGIPRANIYSVLERLEERRAVLRSEGTTAIRYAPVPAPELLDRLGSEYAGLAQAAKHDLEGLGAAPDFAEVWNAKGYAALLDQARAAIRAAQRTLLIAVAPAEASALAEDMRLIEARGVAITTLCVAACAAECGSCLGQIYRYNALPDRHPRWLIVLADESVLVAGEVTSKNDASVLRTTHKLVVELASAYIRHSIALATITEDLDDRLEQQLSLRTKSVLGSLGPIGSSEGFLEYLNRLLRK
jgi:hypothetical protein